MKQISRFLFVAAFLLITFFAVHLIFADPPGPPPLPGGHGYGDNVPEGAPIDGGLIILLGFGLGYGGMVLLKTAKKIQ